MKHIEYTIPPPLLVYTLMFSGSQVILSRLCDVIVAYRRTWQVILDDRSIRLASPRELEEAQTFNGFLMDLVNCLWRPRAFNAADLHAKGCLIPASLAETLTAYVRNIDADLHLAALFDLSHSPVLCFQSIAYVRDLEDSEDGVSTRHAGPVTAASLRELAGRGGLGLTWKQYRLGVLQHLKKLGFTGVPELMEHTLVELKNRKR